MTKPLSEPPSPIRRKVPQRAGIKKSILDAATKLFHEKSYGEVGLYDVAEALSLKQGHVYYHFKTKRELGLAVLKDHANVVDSILGQLDQIESAKARLLRFLSLSKTMEAFYLGWGCPIAGLTDALLRESQTKAERDSVPIIYDAQLCWIGRNLEAVGMKKKDAHAEAERMLRDLQGAIHLSFVLARSRIFSEFIQERRKYIQAL